jgi:hypothetical protein
VKRLLSVFLIFLASAGACCGKVTSIPTGTWKYRLLVNGADIGSAIVTNTISQNRYVSTMEMEMNAGYIRNTMRQIVTETTDFRPIQLEVYSKTVQNDMTHEDKTVAKFNNGTVELETGETRSTVTIKRPFILEGNYFMSELIKNGFKQGSVIKHYIYEPSVDTEEPVLMLVKVIGKESVSIKGANMELVHIGTSIENLKNIDSYIDEKGITRKTVITMLNNRFELILE